MKGTDSDKGRAGAILHPIRLRILHTIQGTPMTPLEIKEALGDVPQATLYRHLKRLTDAGVLSVVGERQVQGTVERTYAVVESAALLTPDELKKVTHEEAATYFRTFVGFLLSAFDRYLTQETIDLHQEGASFFVNAVPLTDEEYQEFRKGVLALWQDAQNKEASPGSRRRTLAFIAVPEPQEKQSNG